MAITSLLIENDLDALADFIDGFNGMSVEKIIESDETVGLELQDQAGHTLCIMQYNSTTNKLQIQANLSDEVWETADFPYYTSGTFDRGIRRAWKCANGIMIDLCNNYSTPLCYPFYIVKTSLGSTAFIFSTSSSLGSISMLYTDLVCVTYGDSGTMDDPAANRKFSFTKTVRPCMVVCPVPTRSEYGVASYTYKSGIVLFNTFYDTSGYGKYGGVISGGKTYLSNTYFAIEDESVTGSV